MRHGLRSATLPANAWTNNTRRTPREFRSKPLPSRGFRPAGTPNPEGSVSQWVPGVTSRSLQVRSGVAPKPATTPYAPPIDFPKSTSTKDFANRSNISRTSLNQAAASGGTPGTYCRNPDRHLVASRGPLTALMHRLPEVVSRHPGWSEEVPKASAVVPIPDTPRSGRYGPRSWRYGRWGGLVVVG
jgi:hypothetical protein